MSLHNAIRYADFIRAFSRAAGMDERDEGVSRLGETLTPTLDLWSRPEWSFVRSERLAALSQVQPAVAAEFSGIALVNPNNSQTLITVEKVAVRADTALQTLTLRVSTADLQTATLDTATSGIVRDSRFPVQQTRARVNNGTDVANLGDAIDEMVNELAFVWSDFRTLPIILSPGRALSVWHGAVNLPLRATFVWRERLALLGEL